MREEGENTRMVPLSVDAKEFSLRTVPKIRISTGEGSDGSGNYIPSREMHGGIARRSDAVVSTTSVAGAPMGSGSHGPISHVCYHSERQSVRPGNGGLFFPIDESVPVA